MGIGLGYVHQLLSYFYQTLCKDRIGEGQGYHELVHVLGYKAKENSHWVWDMTGGNKSHLFLSHFDYMSDSRELIGQRSQLASMDDFIVNFTRFIYELPLSLFH
ncbi:hypothetical protein A2872_02415 [Candidatus Gottesmanbacteria bacterium RIFCSPHIGHO2_01_FULL_42_12]|uniref:Uncharacterized protein n=1 Tax=Candidatus Gottesmanbacteria bacterium RIFCSPHIGHO2_01_FULL_42_12 TaxID=1798377 RepID=A0A1F5Z5L0_9BACT|nr:MAG: hypothetical protein A2872_02415 [Candidatus Gottesmanbacteria bacterium RIFCSPHIGHO2_01_FULL_42_12]